MIKNVKFNEIRVGDIIEVRNLVLTREDYQEYRTYIGEVARIYNGVAVTASSRTLAFSLDDDRPRVTIDIMNRTE